MIYSIPPLLFTQRWLHYWRVQGRHSKQSEWVPYSLVFVFSLYYGGEKPPTNKNHLVKKLSKQQSQQNKNEEFVRDTGELVISVSTSLWMGACITCVHIFILSIMFMSKLIHFTLQYGPLPMFFVSAKHFDSVTIHMTLGSP